ncbi:unnamed protein product [Peniophora sp. CBMAI 1063]|nr:unnamed protein product [Peniophora sp. CBMAI 1063]
MADTTFTGTRSGLCASDFQKQLTKIFFRSLASDADKIEYAVACFPSNSPADKWFKEMKTLSEQTSTDPTVTSAIALAGQVTTTWSIFLTALRTRFPDPTPAQRQRAEIERSIKNAVLDVSTLGKLVDIDGRKDYTHIVFADKLEADVTEGQLLSSDWFMTTVREKLPMAIQVLLAPSYPDWEAFLKGIRSVDVSLLEQGAAQEMETDTMRQRLASLERLMQNMKISPATTRPVPGGPPRPASASRAAAIPAVQAQSGVTVASPPNTERVETEVQLRAVMARYPQRPDTAEGRAKYLDDVRAWHATYGRDARVTGSTGFPIRPGTEPAGTGECWQCGKKGHRAVCSAPEAERVPQKEQVWRRVVYCIRRDIRAAQGPVGVNVVGAEDDYMAEYEYGVSGQASGVWEDEEGKD